MTDANQQRSIDTQFLICAEIPSWWNINARDTSFRNYVYQTIPNSFLMDFSFERVGWGLCVFQYKFSCPRTTKHLDQILVHAKRFFDPKHYTFKISS